MFHGCESFSWQHTYAITAFIVRATNGYVLRPEQLNGRLTVAKRNDEEATKIESDIGWSYVKQHLTNMAREHGTR